MQSSDYRPEVRRHSVICQVSSVCTRLFTLCSHRASSDHRPPVSEAFVAAARAEGVGRGGGGAPGVRNSLACRLQHHHSVTRGGHPLMLSIQRQIESLVRRNHEIFKAMKGFIRGCVRLDWTKPRHSSSPARVLETTGGVDTGPSNTVRAGVGC